MTMEIIDQGSETTQTPETPTFDALIKDASRLTPQKRLSYFLVLAPLGTAFSAFGIYTVNNFSEIQRHVIEQATSAHSAAVTIDSAIIFTGLNLIAGTLSLTLALAQVPEISKSFYHRFKHQVPII